jgi:2-ketoarginine methyltransferase
MQNSTSTPVFTAPRLFNYSRGFAAAYVVHQLIAEGVLKSLAEGTPWQQVALDQGFEPDKFKAVLDYLTVEGILEQGSEDSLAYTLSEDMRSVFEGKGYLQLLVGGYANVFADLPAILRGNPSKRDGRWVSIASCDIAKRDTIPMAIDFLKSYHLEQKLILEVGCGNAEHLATLCNLDKEICAIGVEPDPGGYREGLKTIEREGLGERVELINCGALEYSGAQVPSFIIFGFVLQEIVGTEGIERASEYLRALATKFPRTRLMVFEIDNAISDLDVMKSEMGLGFYNPYYLLHPLTQQCLLSADEWQKLFSDSNYRIQEFRRVDPSVDPTQLVVGYILEPDR